VAVLLNEVSNLRLRLDLIARHADGVDRPAALGFVCAVERYRKEGLDEPRFEPMVHSGRRVVLDLDVIAFMEQLEQVLAGARPDAALQPAHEPALAVHVSQTGPRAAEGAPVSDVEYLVEAGIDLKAALEAVTGEQSAPGRDLSLFRFYTGKRQLHAFTESLIEEYGRFPTDPSKVKPGAAA
jgi:hypothetical protein